MSPLVTNGSPAWTTECPELREEQTLISGDWMSEVVPENRTAVLGGIRPI